MVFSVVTGEIDWWAVFAVGVLVCCVLAISGMIGASLAEERRRDPLAGTLLGMLFGPLGWLLIYAVGRRKP